MTNLGHFDSGRMMAMLLPAIVQTAGLIGASYFLWRYHERSLRQKVWFWLSCALAAGLVGTFFGAFLIAQPIALPLLAVCTFGQMLWGSIRRKAVFASLGFGTLLAGSGFFLLMVVFYARQFGWIAPPTKAEIAALVRQVGPERLRADAATLRDQISINDWEIAEERWPDAFKILKPVLVRTYPNDAKPKNPIFQIFALKEWDSEIIVEVLPSNINSQLEVGHISPESPYGYWREQIAEGVYWYSTLGPD